MSRWVRASARTRWYTGRDIPLVLVPQFSYYGKRFFIDNLDPGVTLFDGESNTLSLVASPGYDRVFFYRSDLQNFFVFSPTSFGGNSGRRAASRRPTVQEVPASARESAPARAESDLSRGARVDVQTRQGHRPGRFSARDHRPHPR